MSDSNYLMQTDHPSVVISESVMLDMAQEEKGKTVWVVFPGEEEHWEVEDWATDGADHHLVPWWLLTMWGAYLVWALWYIVYGSSQW